MVSLVGDDGSEPLFDVGKGHKEMLDAIFSGRFLDKPIGGLKGETAAEILRILNSIRTGTERVQREMQRQDRRYALRDTVETIKPKGDLQGGPRMGGDVFSQTREEGTSSARWTLWASSAWPDMRTAS